jgi:hypothetical protein
MNKKNMEQLKVAIARDLVQGQGHSPTRELLRQYVPLEGIITTPASDAALEHRPGAVEITMAPHATVALRYEKATGNRWNKSDYEAYQQNAICNVPIARIISALEAVTTANASQNQQFQIFR